MIPEMPEIDDEQLKAQLKQGLDQRADSLDGATLSRLRQARAKAIEQPRNGWQGINWTFAGSAAALASVTLVAVLTIREPAPQALPLAPTADALEIATLEHNLELIEEMAFYNWLETQDLETPDKRRSTQLTAEEAALAG